MRPSPKATGSSAILIGVSLFAVTPAQAIIIETGTAARFVRITNNGGASRQLQLGELEAFIAGGTVTSSSLEPLYDKALVSQGASFESQIGTTAHGSDAAPLDAILNTGGATFTLNGTVGAQMVYDLGTTRDLTTVKLWQRADGCCQDRLSNFTIQAVADNGGGLPGATVFTQSFAGQVATDSFESFNLTTSRSILAAGAGVIGTEVVGDSAVRFVRVRNNGDLNRNLGIGEIEAFAAGVVPSAGSGLSTNELTGLSFESQRGSTFHGANTAPFNNILDSGGDVFTLNSAAGNEYVVDLNSNVDLGQVRLFNRADCCQDRLSNYTVSLLKDNGSGVAGDEVFAFSVTGQTPNNPGFTQINIPTIADAFTIRSTDTLFLDIDLANGLADMLKIGGLGTGALTIQSGASLVLNFLSASNRAGNFDVLDFGLVSGSFSNISIAGIDQKRVDLSNLLINGQVSVAPIPEPATATLGLMALGGLMMRRRRMA